jgi:hypothetical protein
VYTQTPRKRLAFRLANSFPCYPPLTLIWHGKSTNCQRILQIFQLFMCTHFHSLAGSGESIDALLQRLALGPSPSPVAPYTPSTAPPPHSGKAPSSEPSFSAPVAVGQHGYGASGAGDLSTRADPKANAALYGAGKDAPARGEGYPGGPVRSTPIYDWQRPVAATTPDYGAGTARSFSTAYVPDPIGSAAPRAQLGAGTPAINPMSSPQWDPSRVSITPAMSADEIRARYGLPAVGMRESGSTYASPIASTDTPGNNIASRFPTGIGAGPSIVPSYIPAPLGSSAAQSAYDARMRSADGTAAAVTRNLSKQSLRRSKCPCASLDLHADTATSAPTRVTTYSRGLYWRGWRKQISR